MKLLRNKSDFREWMMKDFIKIKSEWYPLDYIDAESELELGMPDSFPCLAYSVSGRNALEPEVPAFMSREELQHWLEIMKSTEEH
ncbi:hypothetical protein [Rahnella inusitata]|uniref:hypothetical protein n=1 Tax=Rahnella inusitata TaxID=58169 RepID=UPI001BC840DA|nr:hypothetical protein [Rahnella inusitata]QUT17841.1 hypothetical protein I2123_22345 [Rahnella inusitata]